MTQLFANKQRYEHDPVTNTVSLEIKSPFMKASEMLGWKFKSAGIGINSEIIDFIKTHECNLRIHVMSNGYWYQIPYLKIFEFINYYPTEYYVRNGIKLHVISWDWFKPE